MSLRALTVPYIIVLLIYLVGPVSFSPLYIGTLAILTLSFFSFYFFFVAARARVSVLPENVGLKDDVIRQWYSNLAPVILISSVLLLYWITSRGSSLELLLTETANLREATHGTDPIKQILVIFAYQAYGYIPILFSHWRRDFRRATNVYMAIAIVVMAFCVILQAGRTFFLILPVLIYAAYATGSDTSRRSQRNDRLMIAAGILSLLVGAFFVFIIGVQRVSPAEISYVLSISEYRYGQSWISASEEGSYFATVFFHYLVGPLSNFNIAVFSEDSYFRLSLGPLEAFLSRFAESEWELSGSRWASQYNYLVNGGQPTGWRTGLGNVLDWYGYLGVLTFTAVMGWILGGICTRSRGQVSLWLHMRATWLTSIMLMTLFYFPVDSIFGVNLVLLFLIFPILVKSRSGFIGGRSR